MDVLIPIQPLLDAVVSENASLSRMRLPAIAGRPWLEYVLERLPESLVGHATFVMPESCQQFYFDELVRQRWPESRVVLTPDSVRGELCMLMYACDTGTNNPLLIVSANQLLNGDWESYLNALCLPTQDAAVLSIDSAHPRWPHLRVNDLGEVLEASDSCLLSRLAVAGVYFFQRRQDFMECAEEVVRKGGHRQKEFLLVGTINEMILRCKVVRAVSIEADSLLPLSTAEDLKSIAS